MAAVAAAAAAQRRAATGRVGGSSSLRAAQRRAAPLRRGAPVPRRRARSGRPLRRAAAARGAGGEGGARGRGQSDAGDGGAGSERARPKTQPAAADVGGEAGDAASAAAAAASASDWPAPLRPLRPAWRCYDRAISWACGGNTAPWKVTWDAKTVFQIMVLWQITFWLVGSQLMPWLAGLCGANRADLGMRGQALYSLATDVAEMLAGLGILALKLRQFRPLPSGWFPWRLRGAWASEALVCVALFPFVSFLSRLNQDLLPYDAAWGAAAGAQAAGLEAPLASRDTFANALYVGVVSVCAPVWEECLFRGFLLASLTGFMPTSAAVLVAGVLFAGAHFSAARLLPLTFLGIGLGAIFVRTRNLASCVLLHSLWNATVFLELLV
eukprot:PRCOL_00000126-RA